MIPHHQAQEHSDYGISTSNATEASNLTLLRGGARSPDLPSSALTVQRNAGRILNEAFVRVQESGDGGELISESWPTSNWTVRNHDADKYTATQQYIGTKYWVSATPTGPGHNVCIPSREEIEAA